MRNRVWSFWVVAVAVTLLAVPMFAHHGNAAYDTSKTSTVQGTITSFDFTNPHVIMALDGKDDKGVAGKWQGELTSPNRLSRMGWSKNSLKPGDKVTVTGYVAKSGATSMWITKISAEGKDLNLSGGADN